MSAGRIRSVKPEWLEDERLAFASAAARVMSIGLVLLADDYGNGRANVAWLRGQVFPGDETIEGTRDALAELVRLKFVSLYEVDGQSYFSIRNWDKHQRVDKPGKPRVPQPTQVAETQKPAKKSRARAEKIPEAPESAPEAPAKVPESLAPDLDLDLDQDQEVDLDRDQRADSRERRPQATAPTPPRPPKVHRWRRVPEAWAPSDAHGALAAELCVNLDAEAEKFRDHEFRDPKTDADAAFRTWLRNAASFGGRSSPGKSSQPRGPGDHVDALFERAERLRSQGL